MSGRRHDAESTELRIVQTDADRGNWPPLHKGRIPSSGHEDYVVRASEKTSKDWRTKIANYLRSKDHPGQISNEAILTDFPDDYLLVTHFKRKQDDLRHDSYLFGSRHVRAFRSAAEFFLHADWLRAGMPLNEKGKPDCRCTYCSGVPQKTISNNYDIRKPQNKPSSSRAQRGNANREVQKREYHNIGGAAFRN